MSGTGTLASLVMAAAKRSWKRTIKSATPKRWRGSWWCLSIFIKKKGLPELFRDSFGIHDESLWLKMGIQNKFSKHFKTTKICQVIPSRCQVVTQADTWPGSCGGSCAPTSAALAWSDWGVVPGFKPLKILQNRWQWSCYHGFIMVLSCFCNGWLLKKIPCTSLHSFKKSGIFRPKKSSTLAGCYSWSRIRCSSMVS